MNLIEPSYSIPSWRPLTRLVETHHKERRQELLKKLATVEEVALTTDCWTALTVENYLTITFHYISDDWQTKFAVLLTESLSDQHTANRLAEKMIKQWSSGDLKAELSHASMTTQPM